jgi:glycerophosphoryl diester phosphodiesterase
VTPRFGDGAPVARHRPLVFAHRGGADALPEHTLGAYLRSLEDGADGLECDVRMTRDGHLVCVHDRRLDRTSNGRGRVSRKTLAELDALDFGSWHPAWIEESPIDLSRLLTLDRLLAAVRDCGRPARLLVETKHPSRYGAEVERRLIELLRRHGLADPGPDDPVQVTVMSFAALALRRVRARAPRVPTV